MRLTLGPIVVRWYGLAYVVGFIVAGLILRRSSGSGKSISRPMTARHRAAAVIGLIVGARIGYVMFDGAGAYLKEPLKILATWDGACCFTVGSSAFS